MKQFIVFLATLPRWLITAISLIVIVAMGVVDYLTGDYSLTIFYLFPVFMAAWFAGRGAGGGAALASGVAMFTADMLVENHITAGTVLRNWNLAVETVFLLILSFLVSALRQEFDREKELARTDHLTGALNRRSFYELAGYEVDMAHRHARPLTLAYIDVDDFKAINDRLGHHAGDSLLAVLADSVRNSMRSIDVVARMGGDEFVVLFPETGEDQAEVLLARLWTVLGDAMEKHGWPVTFSVGAVTFRQAPAGVEEMIRLADRHMYVVKYGGKNRLSHETVT